MMLHGKNAVNSIQKVLVRHFGMHLYKSIVVIHSTIIIIIQAVIKMHGY